MMHAVDRIGRDYNKMGMLSNTWTDASIEQFEIKAIYIKNQFFEYEMFGHMVGT